MRFLIAALSFCLFFSIRTTAQTSEKYQAQGIVRSASGELLPGASVVLKGTRSGTTTDSEGRFFLSNVPAGNYTLQVSFSGYKTSEQALQLPQTANATVAVVLHETTYEMETVEVTGKTITQEINTQAYAVTAIDTKALQNSSLDAKEILNRVSGVRVLEEGGLGSKLTFSLNGFSGDQVKFFLDGIPMDNFGSSLNIANIPVNMIERIEVYRGVVPVWLGTDALGGAVNIVTNKRNEFVDVSYSVGSFNTHRVSLNGAHTNKRTGFTVRGNGSYNYSDNNYTVQAPIKQGTNIVDTLDVKRFHDRYRSGSVQIEAGVVNKKYADNLLFGILASKGDQQVQTGATMRSVYGSIVRTNESVIPTLKYAKENLFVEGLAVNLSASYNATRYQTIDTLRGIQYNWLGEAIHDPLSQEGELKRTLLIMRDHEVTSQFNSGYTINKHHSLAFNYAFSRLDRESTDSENPNRIAGKDPQWLTKHIFGLSYKYDFNEKWSTTAFGKYFLLNVGTIKDFDFALPTQRTERFTVDKNILGYGLATTYYLTPTLQLKASYEHAVRMPWASEIFGDGLFVLPNPDLKPEQSNNINLGALYAFTTSTTSKFVVEGTFIYRGVKDLINPNVSIASPETSYGNVNETRTLGAEGSIKYYWKELLHLGVSVTYQNITDQADRIYIGSYNAGGWQKNYQKGFRVPNIPYLFGNAHAGLTFRDAGIKESVLNVNYFFNYAEEYFLSWAEYPSRDKSIPRQTSHNMEVAYALKQGKYNIAVECRNFTDAQLYDRYYLQKPGRAFYVKLRYVFGK